MEMELSRRGSPSHNATTRQDDFTPARNMKHLTEASSPSGPRTLRVYVLALLLATFIAALHAGILFGLADVLTLSRQWAQAAVAERPADVLVVILAICVLFTAHLAETSIWAIFFWKSGQLPSFADGWYFAGTSHTTLGYGDLVLQKPWRSLGPISAINGLLTFGCSTAFLFLVLQNIWQHPL
jgi:ion channel